MYVSIYLYIYIYALGNLKLHFLVLMETYKVAKHLEMKYILLSFVIV